MIFSGVNLFEIFINRCETKIKKFAEFSTADYFLKVWSLLSTKKIIPSKDEKLISSTAQQTCVLTFYKFLIVQSNEIAKKKF
jgi:hypothetical protein